MRGAVAVKIAHVRYYVPASNAKNQLPILALPCTSGTDASARALPRSGCLHSTSRAPLPPYPKPVYPEYTSAARACCMPGRSCLLLRYASTDWRSRPPNQLCGHAMLHQRLQRQSTTSLRNRDSVACACSLAPPKASTECRSQASALRRATGFIGSQPNLLLLAKP